jgi:predicted phosphohydrolase
MKLFWTTDIHLNFLDDHFNDIVLREYLEKVGSGNALVITGDIAEAHTLEGFMETWLRAFALQGSKLYFVLGNHDFYGGSIVEVRERLTNSVLRECWLPTVGVVQLSDKTAMIGHDGWYDGGYGNWWASKLEMTDYQIIAELGPILAYAKDEKWAAIQKYSQESADYIYRVGTMVLKMSSTEKLFVATHVPPFAEASVYRGQQSDATWLPHFSSKLMGDALRKLGAENLDKRIIVLCGHTHGKGLCYPEANIVCHTGYAQYGNPQMASNFLIEE